MPCGSSDTATKIFYMTLQDYVMKVSGDFMERIHKLIVIDIVFMDMLFLFLIWSCDITWLYGHVTLWVEVIQVLPSLVAVGIVIGEICF